MPLGVSPERYISIGPKQSNVEVVQGVYEGMEPDAEDSGDEHLGQGRIVGDAQEVHQSLEKASYGPGGQGTDDSKDRTQEEGMAVRVHSPAELKDSHDEDLNVNGDVDQEKDRDIQPSPECQADECTWAKVIRRKRHSGGMLASKRGYVQTGPEAALPCGSAELSAGR